MKRLFRAVPFLLVLASVACFSILGCGGGGGGDGEAPSAEDEAGEPLEGDDAAGAEEDM